jgi:uncharacterized protein YndB with AHSA1/START domain
LRELTVEREILLPSPPGEVWPALTEAERLEEWFANKVELDARPGGRGTFRWENGEERHAVVETIEAERRLELRWDDTGRVELTLEEVDEGTRLVVRESAPEWSTALELHALALCTAA